MEVLIQNTADMDSFAAATLQSITEERQEAKQEKGSTHAYIVGLSGELGAGKTAFAKSFARALGILEPIPSPTFVLARFYVIPDNHHFSRFVHIDAYRIEDTAELAVLGWTALEEDPKNLILVEWPEHMKESFPSSAKMLSFTVVDETTRKIRA